MHNDTPESVLRCNVVTFFVLGDLKRMHRTNEEAYMNTESRNRRAKASVNWTEATSRVEDKDSSLRRVSDEKGTHV